MTGLAVTSGQVRGVMLVVYGTFVAVLARRGVDLFWFFAGGAAALLVSIPVLLGS